MKNHPFPRIKNISDVLPHIEGTEEFKVIRKGWYTVVNYVVAYEETFPSIEVSGGSLKMRQERMLHAAVRRECRGLIFDSETGELLSRPYHKFFNIGEKPETHPNKINLALSHVILEKLDGSMIRPIIVPGTRKSVLRGDKENSVEFRLGTKAGVTDVAMNAETWVAQRPNYSKFINSALVNGLTPIFEWCSRKNRIVVDYPEDRLVLTAIRHTEKGDYLTHNELIGWANIFDIDLVKVRMQNPGTLRWDSVNEVIDQVRAWEGEEGIVFRTEPGGAMFKVKADAYITLHRSVSALSNEKNVLSVIVNDQLDDLIPILTEQDAARVRAFQREFWSGVDKVASEIVDAYLAEGASIEDQKAFAQQFVSQQNRFWHPFLFGLRKGKNIKAMLVEYIKKALSSQTKVDKARWMWSGAKWSA